MNNLIVIGYDGSEGARRAIEYAGRYFAGHRAAVVTAFEDWPPAVQGDPVVVDGRTRAKTVATAEEGAALARRVAIDAEPRVVFSAEKPWHSIIKVADELDAGLIIVGSHGFNGVRPLVLGSVSHQLGHHAHQPVLAVPTPEAISARREKAEARAKEPAHL